MYHRFSRKLSYYYSQSQWSDSIPFMYCFLVSLYLPSSTLYLSITSSNETSLQNLDLTCLNAVSAMSLCLEYKGNMISTPVKGKFPTWSSRVSLFQSSNWSHLICWKGSMFSRIATSILLSNSKNLESALILPINSLKMVFWFR